MFSLSILKKIYYYYMLDCTKFEKKTLNYFNKKKMFNYIVEKDHFKKIKNKKRSYLYEFKNKNNTKDYYRKDCGITLTFN